MSLETNYLTGLRKLSPVPEKVRLGGSDNASVSSGTPSVYAFANV